MKKISSIAIIAFVVSMGATTVFAQETALTTEQPVVTTVNKTGEVRPSAQAVKQQLEALREKLQKTKESASTVRADLKEKVQNIRETASSTRNEIKQKTESARIEIQNKKEEIRNNVESKRVEIAKTWGEKTMKRLDETVLRLEKVADRIDSRIAKMKTNNIDTAKAEESLSSARQKINQAKEKISAAKSAIAELNTTTAVQGTDKNILSRNIQKIKEQTRIVTESLKSAHQALIQTITELKGKEGVKKSTATSTKEAETNTI